MKKIPRLLISCFFWLAIALLFNDKLQAQSSPSAEMKSKKKKLFFKAAFLDGSRTTFFRSTGGGLTLISQKGWIISGRYSTGKSESPQTPNPYYRYMDLTVPTTTTSTGGGSSSNGGWFPPGGVVNVGSFVGGGGGGSFAGGPLPIKKNNCYEVCKYYKITSLMAGKIFYHTSTQKLRMSVVGGVTVLQLDEAVNFEYVTSQGHTFDREESRKVGASVRIGIELPISKYVGIGTSFEGTLAKAEKLFGLGINLMVGILR